MPEMLLSLCYRHVEQYFLSSFKLSNKLIIHDILKVGKSANNPHTPFAIMRITQNTSAWSPMHILHAIKHIFRIITAEFI